ncbi:MAG TPA: hypothetical protein PKZ43_07520 [Bacteroidales bacterium]|nr:hypothetical protein [Bacteroidales bacterium]
MLGLLNIAWNAGFDIFIELINGEAINLKLFSDIINHTSAVTIFDNKTGDSFILSESDDYFEKERTGQTYSFFDIHKLIELALDADFKVYLI